MPFQHSLFGIKTVTYRWLERDTEAVAIEEVIAEGDTIEEPEVKTVTEWCDKDERDWE